MKQKINSEKEIEMRIRDLRNDIQEINKELEKRMLEMVKRRAVAREGRGNEKLQLIGTLPSVLLDWSLFPTNAHLTEFARQLNIKVKFGNKRSRNEIIGTIISEVWNRDEKEISSLTHALDKIMGKREKGEIKNFFLEWDKVIRET